MAGVHKQSFSVAAERVRVFAQQGFHVANVVANRYLGRPPRYLPILLLFMTYRCNLRCKMCGVCERELEAEGNPELTTEEWKAVLRSAANLKTMIASISGGEPLLRADIYELIRYARDLGMAVHICSNGLLLNSENVRRLRESGVNTVSISVESPDQAIHEQLRGPGSFTRAVEGIRRLRAEAPEVRVGINYVITTVNFRNMAAMVPFAESLGVHQLKVAPIHTNLLHKRKRIEQYANLIFGEEEVAELGREVRELMQAARRSPIQTTSSMFLSGVSNLYQAPRHFRCYAGYAACAIHPSGMMVPCCDMEAAVSVRDVPLDVLWRSREFQELRRQVHTCSRSCWDTTNAELSLRLRPSSLLGEIAETWRDIGFYF